MMISPGDTVSILEGAGSILEGTFTGEKSEGMFAIIVSTNKTVFKRMDNVFTDKETAQARWLVRRFKRLQAQGIPSSEIAFTEADRPALELATELWPEDMV